MNQLAFLVTAFISCSFSLMAFSNSAPSYSPLISASNSSMMITETGDTYFNTLVEYGNDLLVAGEVNNVPYFAILDCNFTIKKQISLSEYPTFGFRGVIIENDDFYFTANNSNRTALIILKYDNLTDQIVWIDDASNSGNDVTVYNDLIIIENRLIISGQTREVISGCDALYMEVDKTDGTVLSNSVANLGSCETYISITRSGDRLYAGGRFNFAGGGTSRMRNGLTALSLDGEILWSNLYGADLEVDARQYLRGILDHGNGLALLGRGDYNGTSASDIEVMFNLIDYEGENIIHSAYEISGIVSERSLRLHQFGDNFIGTIHALNNAGQGITCVLEINAEGTLLQVLQVNQDLLGTAFDSKIIDGGLLIAGRTGDLGQSNAAMVRIDLPLSLDQECDMLSTLSFTQRSPALNTFNIDLETQNDVIAWAPTETSTEESNYDAEFACNTIVAEICNNGIDDDQDGLTDCDDPDCAAGSSSINSQICEGDSIIGIDGNLYASATTVELILQGASGCDSIVIQNISVDPKYVTTESYSICNGEAIDVNGVTYTSSGTFLQSNISSAGCDSILNIIITYLDEGATVTAVTEEICTGGTVQYNGTTYNQAGTYDVILQSAAGCDSLIILTIQDTGVTTGSLQTTICSGSILEINGSTYNQTGIYEQQLTSSMGCDSILTIDLTVVAVIETMADDVTICEGDTYFINQEKITTSGLYEEFFMASNGCDSLVITFVNILAPSSEDISAQICTGESYELEGSSYTSSGSYTKRTRTVAGCDSIINLELTILNPLNEVQSTEFCLDDGIIINGEFYTESGTYTQEITDANGCAATLTLELAGQQCSDCGDGEGALSEILLHRSSANLFDYQISMNENTVFSGDMSIEELNTVITQFTFTSLNMDKDVADIKRMVEEYHSSEVPDLQEMQKARNYFKERLESKILSLPIHGKMQYSHRE